jgi:hypothetical protein
VFVIVKSAGALTVTERVPLMEAVTMSVAVMVWFPAVSRTIEGCVASGSGVSGGRMALGSLLVKWTVPE